MNKTTYIQQGGVDPLVMNVYDLIYCAVEEVKELTAIYPTATISDASDSVHEELFSFEITDTRKNYFKNLLKTGCFEVSLLFQLAIRTKEDRYLLDEIVRELKVT